MNTLLQLQNNIINRFILKQNKIVVRKKKKKFKNFFIKLKLNKKILKKNEYREIINNKKKNYSVYKTNRIKYLKRKLNTKKNNGQKSIK